MKIDRRIIEQITDLSGRQVRRLIQNGIIPKPIKGEFDLVPVMQALIEYYHRTPSADGPCLDLAIPDDASLNLSLSQMVAEFERERAGSKGEPT